MGVFFGGFALIWYDHLPYLLVAIVLFLAAILILIKQRTSRITQEVL
jgi:hypothetical protein